MTEQYCPGDNDKCMRTAGTSHRCSQMAAHAEQILSENTRTVDLFIDLNTSVSYKHTQQPYNINTREMTIPQTMP